MAPRIRTVKPEFWSKERMARVSRDARLLFLGMLNFADDEGRMRGSPLLIRAQVFPYDLDVDVQGCLDQLAKESRIARYVVNGESYIWICNFEEHQKIDKPKASSLPAPPPYHRRVDDASAKSCDASTMRPQETTEEVDREVDREVEGSGEEPRANSPTAPVFKPTGIERFETPTKPRPQWLWEDWLQWAQFTRQDAGLAPDRGVPIHKMEEWWFEVTKWTDGAIQPLCDAFLAFGEDKFWQSKKPPLPIRGFLSQWEKYMPIKQVKRAS